MGLRSFVRHTFGSLCFCLPLPEALRNRLRFARDYVGWFCLTLMVLYWCFCTYVSLSCIIWPGLASSNTAAQWSLILGIYLFLCAMSLTSLYVNATSDPGFVTQAWAAEFFVTESGWQFCDRCQLYRPPRAHHCSRCRHCIRRMDHHCIWINRCVGENNHHLFMQLVMYAFLQSLLTAFVCWMDLAIRGTCQFWFTAACMNLCQEWRVICCAILAALMLVGMFCLGVGQHFNLVMDRTTLDSLRDPFLTEYFVHGRRPKFRSWVETYRWLCGAGSVLTWWIPWKSRLLPTSVHKTPSMV